MQHFIKKAAALVLAMVMVLSLANMALAADFEDMPTDWSADAVQSAVANGLLSGKDGKIAASDNLTRAEMATIITRAFGAEVKDNISFTDVASDAWYADYVAQAAHMGVMNGSNGKFNPAANITRQEVFTVLARALKLADGSAEDLAVFSDGDKVASWAVPTVSALVKAGYVSGSNGALNPAANITRAEFAQVMYNIFNNAYLNQAGTYEEVDGKNVIISSSNVTVKGVEIEGDVVIADGVGDGDVFLEDVAIGGRVVVRGGGMNSVHFRGSKAGNVIVTKVDGNVRVVFDEESTVETVSVEGGKASTDVRIEGAVKNVVVNDATSTVVLADAKVEKLDVAAADAKISLAGATVVAEMTVAEGATNTTMIAEKTAEITKLTTAEDVFIDNTDVIKESNDDEKINPEKPAESGAPEASSAPSGGGAIEPDVDKPVAPSASVAPVPTTAPEATPTPATPDIPDGSEVTGDTLTKEPTETPAVGHNHTWVAKDGGLTAPTCTQAGKQVYVCQNAAEDAQKGCGAETEEVVPALGSHNLYLAEITTQPTCTKTGTGVKKCANTGCTYTEKVVLDKIDHDFTDSTRVGYNSTGHYTCCKYCNTPNESVTAHTGWVKAETPGNVNAAQYHTVKCGSCGYTKNETHTAKSEWVQGETTHYHACTLTGCTAHLQEAAHNYQVVTEDGPNKGKYVCSVCSKVKPDDPDPSESPSTSPEHQHSYTYVVAENGQSCTGTCSNSDGKCDAVTVTVTHTAQACEHCGHTSAGHVEPSANDGTSNPWTDAADHSKCTATCTVSGCTKGYAHEHNGAACSFCGYDPDAG